MSFLCPIYVFPHLFFLRRKGFALSIYATSLCFMFYPCYPMVFQGALLAKTFSVINEIEPPVWGR